MEKLDLIEALPEVFNRTWPALEPETQIILALLLLHSHQIDALPLVFRKNGNNKFVSGYSTLSKFLQTDPREYGSFFKQSCEDVSLELPTIPAEGNLESLLKVFSKTRFGFAWAELKSNSLVGGFVSLRDLLSLYSIRIQHRLSFIAQRVQFLPLLLCPLPRQVASLVKGVKQRVDRPEANRDAKVLGVRLSNAVSGIVAALYQIQKLDSEKRSS